MNSISSDDLVFILSWLGGAYVIGWISGYVIYIFKTISEKI